MVRSITRMGSVGALLQIALTCLMCLSSTIARADESSDAVAITSLLNDFHVAASEADEARYLGYFGADGVFMGTDDWERWPIEAFKDYVSERFAGGTGWHYIPEDRHLAFSPRGDTAWFDEIMVSPRWGRFRGTGVLLKSGDDWKIAHYSLTALVPNERFEDVSKVTSAGFAERRENTQ